MKVYITNRMPEPVIQRIAREHSVAGHFMDHPIPPEKLLAEAIDCHGLWCTIADTIDRSFLERAAQLKIVANFGVGFNHIDVEAATQLGILVTHTPGVLTDATADTALALILAVGRRVVEGDRIVREQRFDHWSPFGFLGRMISGKTIGIVGLGRIGQAVARRAAGFDMRVLYHNRNRLNAAEEQRIGVAYVELDQLLSQSDYVSLHVPLTPQTRHLIGARELTRMKPEAFLINTARGQVVDEVALVDALRRRVIAGAGLDVYENEPRLAPGLSALDNVVLLPHVGSATVETRERMAEMVAENLLAGLEGKLPPNCLNPQVLKSV